MVLGSTAYGITFLRGVRSFGDSEKRRQIDQLETDIAILRRQITAKQNRLSDLRQNPDQLKLEIEDRLKLVPPGTKNFILQDGTQKDAPPDNEPRP